LNQLPEHFAFSSCTFKILHFEIFNKLTIMTSSFLQHQELMECLKARHLEILKLIEGKRVHQLDIPIHGNIGDLLILKGTERFFESNKINIVQIASACNFKETVKPGDVIAFHGGGNFGDLYPRYQKHRESLIEKYPDNRIIILPQTIFFESQKALEDCAAKLKKHRDLHIFVRDEKSLKIAQQMTDNCHLMPDMAHQLYNPTVKPMPSGKRLFLQRIDKESFAGEIDLDWHTKTDWDVLIEKEQKTINLIRMILQKSRRLKLDWLAIRMWLMYKNHLIAKSEKFLLSHDFVITDRLHGHIFSSLLNIPNCVLDNSYGKNSNYMNEWTKTSPIVVSSIEDASKMLVTQISQKKDRASVWQPC
jgi:pyruvyl transferase EpsO